MPFIKEYAAFIAYTAVAYVIGIRLFLRPLHSDVRFDPPGRILQKSFGVRIYFWLFSPVMTPVTLLARLFRPSNGRK